MTKLNEVLGLEQLEVRVEDATTALAVLKSSGAPIKMWAYPHEVESAALDQLRVTASLPWIFKHLAVMPDVHLGNGATIGSVIAMKDAVSPAAVGVDIGCGMAAVRVNLTASDLPDDLSGLRARIEQKIPVGFNAHEYVSSRVDNLPLWNSFKDLADVASDRMTRARQQMGTLGGGNHFLEVCLDETDQVWLVLHSGSRNIGKTLAEYHIGIAKTLDHNNGLQDRNLAVFLANTPEMRAYEHDLFWAQDYAKLNRLTMMRLFQEAVKEVFPQALFDDPISCHHNYVSQEEHYGETVLVTRKGAINADLGTLGIIPGSMGTASYIVRGLGNPESYRSASHGAGRRMSRSAAKRLFTVDDLATQTAGIECRKDAGVVDEIPGAYKDIDSVMENQKTLVEPLVKLHQVLCVKG